MRLHTCVVVQRTHVAARGYTLTLDKCTKQKKVRIAPTGIELSLWCTKNRLKAVGRVLTVYV